MGYRGLPCFDGHHISHWPVSSKAARGAFPYSVAGKQPCGMGVFAISPRSLDAGQTSSWLVLGLDLKGQSDAHCLLKHIRRF